jgi:hypothetical protein
MFLKFDGTPYPEVEPPDNLDISGERKDFIARLCSVWDFGLLPDGKTAAEL